MFMQRSSDGYITMLDGIERKTLAYGNATLMTEFRLGGGNPLPVHHHPYEQTGYLVSGRIRLKIGDEVFDAMPGDSWCIPADVPHGADIIEDSVAVEVFSPVREDYLPDRESDSG